MQDDNWIKAIQEELDQFQKNDVWKLVKLPKGMKVVVAKQIFRNKLNKNGKVKSNVIKCNLPLVMQIVIEKKKVHITI